MRGADGPPRDGATPLSRLLTVMERLRHPAHGCPWDREQTFASIAPYTIEEAYEVADAIERNDLTALREELGDLLFQVVFHARMAEEAGLFAFQDVAASLVEKMVRRHPHVFGDARVADAADQTEAWEAHKAAERGAKAEAGALDGVPANLPALARAQKIQRRAARVGFDWAAPGPALDKVREETEEAAEAIAADAAPDRIEGEIGDLLFACVNVARLAGVDAESALRRSTLKFERRFRYIEAALLAAGRRPQDATLAEMDALWERAKADERGL